MSDAMPRSEADENKGKFKRRTPALLLHQPELARQAARQPAGHRRIDLGDHHHHQPASPCAANSTLANTPRALSSQMPAINIKRAEFHGEWNYTISPNTHPPNHAFIS
jgi:hypothetical protein